jgi:hypothetical protein
MNSRAALSGAYSIRSWVKTEAVATYCERALKAAPLLWRGTSWDVAQA